MQLLDDLRLTAPAPNAVSGGMAQRVGTPGTRQFWYWVLVHYPIGNTVSGPFFVRDAPEPLNGSNYVLVVWDAAIGATSYDVLRTNTEFFPNQAGNYLLDGGLTVTSFRDQGQAPANFDPTGLPWGAPVSCHVHLNNRDYVAPTLELPCQLRVSRLLFSDGSSQDTAGGGGGGGNPGGANMQIQFNDNGAFGGSANLVWNNALQRLGINTANPQYNLDVNGSARVVSLVFPDGSIQTSSGQKQTPWESNIDGATFRLFNAGSIGVGTITEQSVSAGTQILMQGGPSDVVFSAVNTTSNATSALRLRSGPVTGGFEGVLETSATLVYPGLRFTGSPAMHLVSTTGPMVFNSGPGTRMFIANNTGFIGIGTTTPAVRLDVEGDARINGGLRVGIQAQAPAAGDLGVSHNPNPTQGIIRFGNTLIAYIVYTGTSFYFTHPVNVPQLILRDSTNTVTAVMSISLDNRGWIQITDNAANTRAFIDQSGRWYLLPAFEVSSGIFMSMPGMEVGYYVESSNDFGKPGFACVSASSGSSCYMFIAGRSLGITAGIAENFNMMCSTDIVFHTNTNPPFSGEVMRLTKGGRVSITPPGQRGDPQFQLDVEGDINIKDPAPGINGFTFRINGTSVMSLIATVESRLAADEARITALETGMAG